MIIDIPEWANEPCCITVSEDYDAHSSFCKYTEPKWVEFCKEHHFDNVKDAHGKIYEMYLVYCAEGLI